MPGKVFISYSHQDSAVSERIVSELTGRGVTPWIDKQEVTPGQSIIGGMNTGLTEASYVLVLFSPDSAKSVWVQREWMSALSRKVPVIPVLLSGGEVPAIIADLFYFDLRKDQDGGIRRIADFFAAEIRPLQTGTSRDLAQSPLKAATRRQLRLVASRCMDETALSAFCYDAEVEFNSLHGSSMMERLMSLLHLVNNDGLATQFASWVAIEKRRCVDHRVEELKKSGDWDWP